MSVSLGQEMKHGTVSSSIQEISRNESYPNEENQNFGDERQEEESLVTRGEQAQRSCKEDTAFQEN